MTSPSTSERNEHSRIISRRSLLRCALSAALLLPPLATSAAPNDSRSLSFVHTHTGEKLSTMYWSNGVYQNHNLSQLNYFLRDFRTNETTVMDRKLFDILYDLQTLADREATYEVISAYRSPQTNAFMHKHSSGVAEHSLHIVGQAIDVRVTGFSTKKLQQLALSAQRGGVGFYAKSDFVHLDTGRVRTWLG